MANNPSYNGIGSPSKTVLRISPKTKIPESTKRESNVTTNNPRPSTPSPRGHA